MFELHNLTYNMKKVHLKPVISLSCILYTVTNIRLVRKKIWRY